MKKKVIIVGILLIVISVVIMLIPQNSMTDTISDDGNTRIEEPMVPSDTPIISEAGAIKIVSSRIKNCKAEDIMEFSQEYRNGGWVYEGSVKSDKKGILYSFQIDADLGTLLEWAPIKETK